jgi:membrane protease YdiL (CAAX protease family)
MAGPIEESLFFGIPFYLFGNHFVPFVGGIIWGMLHIINTNTIEINQLDYANWLFVIPSLFFSLRTWISRKGWFAIIAHSLWNVLFFSLSCYSEEIICSFDFNKQDITSILLAAILLTITYFLTKRMRNRKLLNKV